MASPAHFGALLRRYRAAAGLTQEELAEQAGLSVRAISDLERGVKQSPRYETVRLLGRALRLSAQDQAAFTVAARATEGRPPEALVPMARPRHNLPLPPTPIVGRDDDVSVLSTLLQRDGVRLLTLTGPGGVGKTRMALHVAETMGDAFAGGVCFVALAAIVDSGLVASTIAQALELRDAGEEPLSERLAAHLKDQAILLVLDNFEQVAAAAPLIAGLLASCPGLKVLVTSRAALCLRGEHEYAVQPLALPAPSDVHSLDALAGYPAVNLFVQRAQATKLEFQLTMANAPAVAEICRRLDGLPLAIELAAARVKVLPAPALLARLERRLHVLTDGALDLPPRQQTLRGAIAWSYDLLDAAEQALFRRVMVFAGGCTLEAAEDVCRVPGDLDVLAGLTSLVNKSLLQSGEQADGEPRFTALETIREYGLERLDESDEAEAVRRRHATHYADMAARAAAELTRPGQAAWLERLELEHDNLRAALRWARTSDDAALGLRLAGTLWRFWYLHGHTGEGQGWLGSFLTMVEHDTPGVDLATWAMALNGAGVLAEVQSDHERARAWHEQSLAVRRSLDDTAGIAASLSNLGNVAIAQAEYDRARALYEESLELRRRLGDPWSIALSLNNLGEVARCQGNYTTARALHEESLALRHELGDTQGIATSLINLAHVALAQGEYERALVACAESLALREELGDRRGAAVCLRSQGEVAYAQGQYTQAQALFVQSVATYWPLSDKLGTAECLEGLARVASVMGEPERAASLSGVAATLRASIGVPRPPGEGASWDRDMARARAALGEDGFQVAFARGMTLPLDHVIDAILAAREAQPAAGR